jgi:hypothetical protein
MDMNTWPYHEDVQDAILQYISLRGSIFLFQVPHVYHLN